jgi:CubicO group peptidase (beta-lactamase class C family)
MKFSHARLERLTGVLRADVDAGAIPGAVLAILHQGRRVYGEAFGFADRHTLREMRFDSIFRIASMTKPITVVAALILLERGALRLADPVSTYIPELLDLEVGVEKVNAASGERSLRLERARRAITVQDLMRHTAGFTYGQFGDTLVQRQYGRARMMDSQQTNAQMINKIAKIPLAFHPGSTFEYGMSTDVLGRLIEVVAQMELDLFFAEQITGPLRMNDTGFGLPARSSHRLAQPNRQAQTAVLYDPADAAKWFSGGGGLLSTAGDYARFCHMLLNGGEWQGHRVLSRKTVELMTSNHLPPAIHFGSHTPELGAAAPLPALGQGYGLGVGVRVLAAQAMAPGSVGDYYWGGAAGPYFWVDPREDLAVVFMLQELDVQRRIRYRPLIRALVYQALE